eukprot:4492327-Pyramimonas_sp.AAC.1
MAFPMAREVDGCDPIARRPVDLWERAEGGAFAVLSRCGSALKLSKNDEGDLCSVLNVALKELCSEGNLDPEEVKKANKKRRELRDSAKTPLDGTE